MSWTLTKSWTIICGSRQDQEEGGELDSHEELDYHLRVQARSRGGRWSWAQKAGLLLLPLFLNSCATGHLSLWFCSAQQLKQQLAEHTSYFALARSPLP